MQTRVVTPVLKSAFCAAAAASVVAMLGAGTPTAAFFGLIGLAAVAYPRGWNDDT